MLKSIFQIFGRNKKKEKLIKNPCNLRELHSILGINCTLVFLLQTVQTNNPSNHTELTDIKYHNLFHKGCSIA